MKNCDQGLENAARGRQNLTKALPWPVGRYRRILPALTTNQNAGFVTVPSENKIKDNLPVNVELYDMWFYLYIC